MNFRQKISKSHERQVEHQMRVVYGDDAEVCVQPGSGNQEMKAGDVRVRNRLLIECKCTMASVLNMRWEWLDKIRQEAIFQKLQSVVAIKFTRWSTSVYYLIDDEYFMYLLQCERDSLEAPQPLVDIDCENRVIALE